ncbi:ATP-binding cassette domain-containing protein [Fructobacillus sp. M1-13]|uniref:ATP-binding cassette domain-containing protein n=1 Tax=Fructobacillus papyriferae TaxID=2713171 RepID=A0ABS5QRA9_9LACO|nr:ATP-binding cassette domain-containing protein [Fructobacillus papyriferae]MBS9334936.1 ATP-binding cassette domain-containing protein [Fructobacillus papyriferae]MCD2159580.1 ATP-binding cassette domain-containing protein [Fructobacillus papyriferae]
MNEQIRVSHYGATFGKKTILKDLSFSLAGNQLTVVLGENGAGKTTLIKAILQAALVKSKGKPVQTIQVQAKRLAYVPQFRDLGADYPLSIQSFVGLGIRDHGLPWLTKKEKAAVSDALRRLDLAEIADLPLAKASGGQKQRAYIAQALAKKPDLLILDEPSSALDGKHAAFLVEQIRQVQQDFQMGVLWISHDTSWVRKTADSFLWLHDQTVTMGAAKDLPKEADSKHREEVLHVF